MYNHSLASGISLSGTRVLPTSPTPPDPREASRSLLTIEASMVKFGMQRSLGGTDNKILLARAVSAEEVRHAYASMVYERNTVNTNINRWVNARISSTGPFFPLYDIICLGDLLIEAN